MIEGNQSTNQPKMEAQQLLKEMFEEETGLTTGVETGRMLCYEFVCECGEFRFASISFDVYFKYLTKHITECKRMTKNPHISVGTIDTTKPPKVKNKLK